MLKKAVLSFILVSLCLGCASSEWVKEHVRNETAGLQVVVDDTVKAQEELKNSQEALEGQIKELYGTQEAMDKKLAKWHDTFEKAKEDISEQKAFVITEAGRINAVRLEIEEELEKLKRIERELDIAKETLHRAALRTDIDALKEIIGNLERYIDTNLEEVFKAQNRMKDFLVEKVSTLRDGHQDYVKEIKEFKSRLEALEKSADKEKQSSPET